MRENQSQFVRSCSKFSPKRISNVSTAAATRPLLRSGAFIHGRTRGVTNTTIPLTTDNPFVQGSKGTNFSFCQNLPDMSSSSRRITPYTTQLPARITSPGNGTSISKAPIPAAYQKRVIIWWPSGPRSGTARLFWPIPWPWLDGRASDFTEPFGLRY